MPEEWRDSVIFENKGGVRSCSGCGGVRLVGRAVGLWERVVGEGLGGDLKFGGRRCGFVPGRSAADALFALRVLVGRCGGGRGGGGSYVVCLWTWRGLAAGCWEGGVWCCVRGSGLAERCVGYV